MSSMSPKYRLAIKYSSFQCLIQTTSFFKPSVLMLLGFFLENVPVKGAMSKMLSVFPRSSNTDALGC